MWKILNFEISRMRERHSKRNQMIFGDYWLCKIPYKGISTLYLLYGIGEDYWNREEIEIINEWEKGWLYILLLWIMNYYESKMMKLMLKLLDCIIAIAIELIRKGVFALIRMLI